MKQIFSLVTLFIIFNLSKTDAQDLYGNEWINLNQTYYSIPVAEDGIYQVSGQFLLDNGIDITSFSASEIQLWYRGKELAILVEDGGDNTFNAEDRFIFYGRKNDGQIDSSLYFDPALQANQYYNLFSDTSKYFFTWATGVLGKRMDFITGPSSVVSSDVSSHIAEYLEVVIEDYSYGREPVSYVYNSQYDLGEGWFSTIITKNKSKTVSFSGLNSLSGSFTVELQLVGRNNLQHDVEVSVGSEKFNVKDFNASEFKTVEKTFSSNLISDGKLNVTVSPLGVGGEADAISIGYVKLTLEESLNNNQKPFNYWNIIASENDVVTLTKSSNVKYVFDITSEYDVDTYGLSKKSDSTSFKLNNDIKSRYMSIAESGIKIPDYVSDVYFENDESEADYLIITHPRFWSGAQAYAEYRESLEGGAYNTKVISVNRLYDQYAYGAFTPKSIRNYLKYIDDSGHKPKYLFLIGNGSLVSLKQSGRPYYRFINFDGTDYNGNVRYGNVNYLPTMGNPGSDILYSSGLFGSDREPGIPTGRIGVKENSQVYIYLNKVKQHDQLSYDQPWRKKALHLSGGEANEAPYFLSRMNQLGNKFQSPLVGGKVETLTKKTDKEVEFFNLSKYVNSGIGFLSFIGHSSPSVIEIDIGEVDDDAWGYNNPNKYPVLYLNGCHTGDIYSNNSRLENWLFSTPNRGAIAALGHTSFGYSSELFKNADDFYELAFNDTVWYKESLGHIHQQMVKEFDEGSSNNNIREESFWPQFSYYGDPAVHLFSPLYAEFTPLVNTGNITSFNGDPVTVNSDSIYISFTLANYGKVISDSVEVCIKRSYNGGEIEQILDPITIPSVYFEEDIVLAIENPKDLKGGLNEFEISINCNQKIEEYKYDNNSLKFSYVFNSDAHFNLLPYNFSMEENLLVHFAYHSFNLENNFTYEFELDTSRYFSAPLIKRVDQGTVINFQEELPIVKDSTIYYWRTRIINNPDVDTAWRQSTFAYMQGKSGWGQFNATQLSGNSIKGITYSKKQNTLSFQEIENVIKVVAPGKQVVNYQEETEVSVNGQGIVIKGGLNSCSTDGIYVLAFDKTSGLPYHTSGDYNGNCGVRPRIALDFNNLDNQGQRTALKNYMNTIPEDAYVLISSSGRSRLNSVKTDQDLLEMFHEFGAVLIDNVEDNKGYIFLGQRGGNAIFEAVAETENEILTEEILLEGKQYKSQIETSKAGPANSWDSLVVNMTQDLDKNYFTLFGLTDNSGMPNYSTVNRTARFSTNLSAVNSDSSLSFYLYSETIDSVRFSYPENHDWAVFYKPVAEGVLINTLSVSSDLDFYEYYQPEFEFINVSKTAFKNALSVIVKITNSNTQQVYLDTLIIEAPEVNSKEVFKLNIPVIDLIGENHISVIVNPEIEKEQNYTNNYWENSFIVLGDQLNPLLSVTFDEKQIRNEDVVSGNTKIKVIGTDLWNGINSISDSSAQITIIKLCNNESNCLDTMYTSDDFLFTTESSIPKWEIVTALTEGKYKLVTKVSDNSKNSTEEYSVTFNVKDQLGFRFLPVYPNPATESINFEADLLGGNNYPEKLEIEIYNVSGVKIYTLNKADFQKINFGKRGISLELSLNTPILTSGIYFYTFRAVFQEATFDSSGKLFIIK